MPVTQQEFSLVSAVGPFFWPLLLLSLVALAFFLERTYFLHKSQIGAAEFLNGIKNSLRRRHFVEATTTCQETFGPVPRIAQAILARADGTEVQMRSAATETALLLLPSLERRVGAIAAVAKIAPLLGLIGTVVALLNAFRAMQAQGHYATADAFAGDIAAALCTTAASLFVAALAHLEHHFLAARIRSVLHDIEWTAHSLIQFLAHELPDEARPRTKVHLDEN